MAAHLRQSLSKLSSLLSRSHAVVQRPILFTSPVAQHKFFSTSSSHGVKEIREVKEGKVITIEGVKMESDRSQHVLPKTGEGCTLCRLNLDLKYTDVLILSQFLRADGCLLPRRITGVCRKQQNNLRKLIHQAQRAGLLPQYRPDLPEGQVREGAMSKFKWKRYNVYFE